MIAENRQPNEVFAVSDILKCFYTLLNTVGGKMTVLKGTLDNNVPKDFMERIRIEHIIEPDAYVISISKKKKQKRGIIHTVNRNKKIISTQNRRLIIPD